MASFDYVIKDEIGLHARPAGLLVKEAKNYTSEIEIAKGEAKADAKKLLAVMKLGVKCGDTITITATGDDADKAAAELEAFVKANV